MSRRSLAVFLFGFLVFLHAVQLSSVIGLSAIVFGLAGAWLMVYNKNISG